MSRLDAALWRASAETFEQLGFLFAEEEPTEEQAAQPAGEGACVAFRGPVSGVLHLRVSEGVLPELVANMLGVLPPLPAAVERDALKEVANVICGNVLPELGGAHAVFDLAAPESWDGVEGDGPGKVVGRARLGVGLGRAEVCIRVVEGEPVGTASVIPTAGPGQGDP